MNDVSDFNVDVIFIHEVQGYLLPEALLLDTLGSRPLERSIPNIVSHPFKI